MAELALADLVPLWRTLNENGVTALVTPALDYVGCLELGGVDVRFVSDDVEAAVGEQLRSLVGGLEDDMNLLFLYRVYEGNEGDVQSYEAAAKHASPKPLADYVAARAEWLREQPVRRARLFLFFCQPKGGAAASLERGHLGLKLLFKPLSKVTRELHVQKLQELATLRDRLVLKLGTTGLGARELRVDEVQQLHYELLNPSRARRIPQAPDIILRDNLWSEKAIARGGDHLREFTEAEQLCVEDIHDAKGHMRQGELFRRVVTLKTLPESGTGYFMGRALQHMHVTDGDETRPMAFTLAVSVQVQSQAFARWRLDTQHKLVEALRTALPFLQSKSIAQDVEDSAKQSSIANLFAELSEMATKVVSMSVSMLLEAPSLSELDAQTASAERAFAAAGNSTLYVEEVSQVPALLSMMPGAGPYQLRKKGCTSRNAADFLPVAMPWTGGQTHSLMPTPSGEFFRFALFDKSFGVNAHHGLVAADTGSGKSFAMGMLVLDALAAGVDAILVDNGNSWKHLTELMGGIHIPVDLNTSISPFLAYEHMLDGEGRLDNEAIRQIVRFIEICVTDHNKQAFDLIEQQVVGRAISLTYLERFKGRPSDRPLLGDFRAFLQTLAKEGMHPKEREVAADVHLRLAMFCDEDGVYSKFLNRPSQLRFDGRLLTFEMEKVSKDPLTKKIAMAAVMEAVSNRAASRKAKTVVAVDEAHDYLGNDPAAETFLAGCYAKMRKYDVAMWTISQKFETFANCRVAPVIVGNSALKLFLWHSSGHSTIGNYFKLPRGAVAHFASLEKKPGRYSDAFLMYGTRMATVRFAPNPLAYWILTTDGDDKRLIEKATEKNPHLSRMEILQHLAERYPQGYLFSLASSARGAGRAA